jgi:hypothetical protein
MTKQDLIKKIDEIDLKIFVYSQFWGNNSDEIKQLVDLKNELDKQYLELMGV